MDDDAWEDQLEAQCRLLGTASPRCTVPGCDETNPFALTGTHPNIVCYEHRAHAVGRDPVEAHHPAGRHNDPTDTIAIPGNDHRILSARQRDWPIETLRNRDGSPLLRAAASLRGWLDVLWLLIVRTVGWIPAFLEWLDAQLVGRDGTRWWIELGWTAQP